MHINPLAKIITAVGFVLAVLAFASVALGANRSFAIHVFAGGFVLTALGITINILLMPAERFVPVSPIGMKVAAVGFGLAAIPTAIGGFFFGKPDSDLAFFFWPGFALVIVGVILHAWSIVTNRS